MGAGWESAARSPIPVRCSLLPITPCPNSESDERQAKERPPARPRDPRGYRRARCGGAACSRAQDLAQDRPARLACRPQHAPDRHLHPTRSAFSPLASLQVIEFVSLSHMPHDSLDSWLSPVLSPVAPAHRSPSLLTLDGRLSLGHIEPDAAGGANLQVDRASEPRPCPDSSAYCRAPLSDARLLGRSSASEAVGDIALWRVPGT